MKHVLHAIFLALALVCAGCGKYEVYERNLVYMTQDTLVYERAAVEKRVQEAQSALTSAEASGDDVRINQAKAEYKDAAQQKRIIESEIKRRARGW